MNTTNFLTIFITITFLLVIKKNYAQEVRVIDNKGTIKKVRNNQVTTSATSPASPLEGDIWFDNSNTPTLIKIYDGSVWLDPSIEFYQQIVRTPGSIYFANTTGLPTEDNAQLFWDNTNNYLGIGTNSPNNKLDVLGAINTRGILNSNGTVSEPSFRFKNDTDTGIFRPNLVDEMGFSAGGVEAMHIEEDANTTLVTIKNTLALDGNLLDENDASGTAGQILSATATGTDWIDNLNNQVTTSSSTPINPIEGDVWFDTTNSPTLIKIYDGSVWLDPSIEFYQQIVRTPGSIYFANTTGLPTEDNAKLFWNNANNYLGIGTNTPANELDVIGTVQSQGILNSSGILSEPSYSFTNDTDTGMFRPTNDEIGLVIGGTEAINISKLSSGNTKTTINQNIELEGQLLDINNESGTAGQILSATATGTDWVSVKSTDSSISVTTDSNNNIDLSVTPSVVTAGTCTTVTGSGTSANPYVVTAIADVVSAVYTESSINYVDITKCTASGTVTIKVRVY